MYLLFFYTYPGYAYTSPMSYMDRIRKYRERGGAADLVRVEVLVPPARRHEITAAAQRLRAEHRARKKTLEALMADALKLYGVRVRDNIDLSKLADPARRARVVARALQERGDARAFRLGRQLLDAAGAS